VGEILTAAFEIYKDNAAKLLLIVAVVVVPLSLIGALISNALISSGEDVRIETIGGQIQVEGGASVGEALLGGLIVAAIAVIISAVLQAAILRGAAQASIGDPVDIETSYRFGLRKIGSVILVGLLVGLAVGIGFILLIIPGVIALVFFSVSIPALVIENRRGTEAMSRSWNLVSGSFWHAFGLILVAALITALVGGLLSALGGDSWLTVWIFSAIGQIVTMPFAAIVSVLLYLDLRARKEALTTDVLRRELAANL
jgi:hypothetical protein